MLVPQSLNARDAFVEREPRWRGYLQNIRQGDEQSLTRLYNELSPTLYGLALRIVRNPADAEEVLLEVFEQVWRKASTFDPARGTVWGWLILLTRSRSADRLRHDNGRRRHEQATAQQEGDVTSLEPLPDDACICRQQQATIREAMSRLPGDQRMAMELACFSELTHVEIAAALAVPLGTVKTRIRTGMEKLRADLAEGRRDNGEQQQ